MPTRLEEISQALSRPAQKVKSKSHVESTFLCCFGAFFQRKKLETCDCGDFSNKFSVDSERCTQCDFEKQRY